MQPETHQPYSVASIRGITPRVGWLTVNRECNLRCQWCYAKGTEFKASEEMSLDLANKLSVTMISNGVKNITLIGGEPTLWRHLFDYQFVSRNNVISTTIVTNGSRFGVDKFWAKYIENPCTRIGLSIKSFSEESHRCVTGRNNFDLTKRGIERALGFDTTGASVVFTGEETDEIISIARFAAACGAKALTISPSTPSFVGGRAEAGFVTKPEKFVASLVDNYTELNELFEGRINISVKLPLCIWPRKFVETLIERGQIVTTCQLQHRTGLIFDPKGKLISCNSLHDFPIGQWGEDFSDSATLAAHIGTQKVSNFYDSITAHASNKCTSCSMKAKCGGGCPLFYSVYEGQGLVRGWDNLQ
jgi:radical SAM protein with 4Fe4S-binding SPASM domain